MMNYTLTSFFTKGADVFYRDNLLIFNSLSSPRSVCATSAHILLSYSTTDFDLLYRLLPETYLAFLRLFGITNKAS